MFDLLLKNAVCLTPAGRARIDVGVKDGTITALGDLSTAAAATVLDLTGLHVLPGVIDSQVHFREPGNEHKEDLATGTRSAVLGGVTAIFEMPNTKPATTTAETLNDKLNRAAGRAWCDYAFFVGGTPERDKDWSELEHLPGCSGIKIFMGSSTGNLLVAEDDAIFAILQKSRRRIAVHAEDEARLNERFYIAEQGAHPRVHHVWRDDRSALLATERLLKLARRAGALVHVLHVTTDEEMELLAQHKDICTVEATPQHLTLAAPDAYERLGTYAQMNPPIRGEEHRAALWRAVQSGIVDVIGSDHAPHTHEEKAKPYPQSPSGMPGVQTLVPLMLDHVNAGRLTLERFVDLTAAGPARIFNIARKGRLAVGYDADFTVVDLQRQHTIDNAESGSRCGWTPFHGMTVTGWPTHTIIRGQVVMQEGDVLGQPVGQAVRFQATLQPQ